SSPFLFLFSLFSFTPPAPSLLFTLSLHDALPIYMFNFSVFKRTIIMLNNFIKHITFSNRIITTRALLPFDSTDFLYKFSTRRYRSEEHTSELQSRFDLVCRLLLEKKKTQLYNKQK